jgi:hypothetical protein
MVHEAGEKVMPKKPAASPSMRSREGTAMKNRERRVRAAMARIRAIEERWLCSPQTAQYIHSLESAVDDLQRICAEHGIELRDRLRFRVLRVMRGAVKPRKHASRK